jgi:putative DNA primase/helicase
MSMPKDPPRHINPFRTCPDYQRAGWGGTLPLPAKEKNPPPTGFTGHSAPWPTKAQLLEWLNDPKRRRANICLRLGGVDDDYEVIGIDVDHYLKGGKEKRGGDQLEKLEDTYGPLPPTWISSARTDGVSGIRYFRVPRGLAFRGQVDKDIEVIQKGHRFAVVWPSYNPDSDSYYWWFPPGAELSVSGRSVWREGQLPIATELPLLPDKWIDYLTHNRIAASDVEIDMESSVDDIFQWGYDNFGLDQPMCYRMNEKAAKHIKLIQEEATSHDKLVNAHMNIFLLATEGHQGWDSATLAIEKAFAKVCEERDKRSREELRGEIFRSRSRGLRRVKAKVDAARAIGADGIAHEDLECGSTDDQGIPLNFGSPSPPDEGLFDIPRGKPIPTPEYRMNDDGNADHFCDMWSNGLLGPVVRFVEGYGWIIWHNGDGGERYPHWELDPNGMGTMRQMWWEVRDRHEDYAEDRKQEYINVQTAYQNQQPGVSKTDLDAARSTMNAWKKFAISSGMNRTTINAIEAVKTHTGVRMSINDLDASPDLLGVSNGVIELNPDGPHLRLAEPNDYVTMNTNVAWDERKITTEGKRLWNAYLDKFLPDKDYRRDVQIILGHGLIGGNPHKKLIIFKGTANTGKSVMITMINTVLGDYAKTTNRSLFTYHKLNPVLATALPKRVVSIIELSRDSRNPLTVDQMKTATGNDYIEAELKGSNVSVNRVPFFLPIMVTNTVPTVEGHDKALRERLRVIAFDVVEENPDDTIAARMRTESATAALDWLVEGYRLYCANERMFPDNERMRFDTDEFVSELDIVSKFASDSLIAHSHMGNMSVRWQDQPEWSIKLDVLYSRYELWFNQMNFGVRDRLPQPMLTMRLRELGYIQLQHRFDKVKDRRWVGVKLKGNAPITKDTGLTIPMKAED